jgi:hypothetical protein
MPSVKSVVGDQFCCRRFENLHDPAQKVGAQLKIWVECSDAGFRQLLRCRTDQRFKGPWIERL